MDMFRMLDYGFYQAFSNMGAFGTSYDVKETEEEYILTMGIPGLLEDDVDVKIKNARRLLIKSNRASKFTPEFNYAFLLPANAIKKDTYARIENGVLEVHIKKAEEDEYKVKLK